MPKVAIIMGSISDFETVKPASEVLKEMGVETEIRILSAHRTPGAVHEFTENAHIRGVEVIIAAAGKAAHLAGVVAGGTVLPVIGIPIKTSDLGGMDSLLSTVQMPSGIPVATVAINGAENAGVLAAQILSVKYPQIRTKLLERRKAMQEAVLNADRNLDRQ